MTIQIRRDHRRELLLTPAYTAAEKIRTGSYWRLEEATSATRNDAIGSNNLTDVNNVTQAAGKVNYGAGFAILGLRYLTILDNPSLSGGDIPISVGAWVKLDSVPAATMMIVSKGTGLSLAGTEYSLYYSSARNFRFIVGNGVSTVQNAIATSPSPPNTGQWYWLFAWHDPFQNTVNIQVDNGTVYSSAYSSGIQDSALSFNIGANSTPTAYFDGTVDETFVCKQLFTPEERTFLYNNGYGQTWPWI